MIKLSNCNLNNMSNMDGITCCGVKKYVFEPQVLFCYANKGCVIRSGAEYWYLRGGLTFCENCVLNEPSETLKLSGEFTIHGRGFPIQKRRLSKKKNVGTVPEPIIKCDDCGKIYHEICVLYSKEIWPGKYICDACLQAKGGKRHLRKYTAKGLQETQLSSFMERRVNAFLRLLNSKKDVVIRVVANVEKHVKVKPAMRNRYNWLEEFPYRAKTILAFQKFDGDDICFFGMHVQEYNNKCPEPNKGCVYISHIDTVPYCAYFEPNIKRKTLYHEIILSYLSYMKKQNYVTAHVWACPPHPCDDYIFYCHPSTQKIPTAKKLQNWFTELFDEGVKNGIIRSYCNIAIHRIERLTQVPYFDDDFLPVLFERCITQLNTIEVEEKFKHGASLNVTTVADIINEDLETVNQWQKVDYKSKNTDKEAFTAYTELDLIEKVYAHYQNYKKMCFVVKLQTDTPLPLSSNEDVASYDHDPIISYDNLLNRDCTLQMLQTKHLEFSTVRRAKYSTLVMLYYLHVHCQMPVCIRCKKQIETRFVCVVCENYTLCSTCFNSSSHDHAMEKYGLGLDEHDPTTDLDELLRHTFCCLDQHCKIQWCKVKKTLLDHMKICRDDSGACRTCFEINCLCFKHSFSCQEDECKIPRCLDNQRKVLAQQMQLITVKDEALRRKISVMENFKAPEQSSDKPQVPIETQISPNSGEGSSPDEQHRINESSNWCWTS